MAEVASYNMPQGIEVGGRKHQAVPRKTGAYDTEGVNALANIGGTRLTLFQSPTAFAQAGLLQAKTYGRDTNITSTIGGMAKGERLYAYGITMKIGVYDTILNAAAAAVAFDQWRVAWDIGFLDFRLGGDEFIVTQLRDIPTATVKAPRINGAAAFVLTSELPDGGMYDLTISGDPYVLDQQEDFRVRVDFTNPAGAAAALITNDFYVTVRLEGIRLKSLRQ